MKQNKSMAMKARVANAIRKALYKKPIDIPNSEKLALFDQIYNLNRDMHWELLAYKQKKKDRAALYQRRLNAPQTKTMLKKLGPKTKHPKINLEKL